MCKPYCHDKANTCHFILIHSYYDIPTTVLDLDPYCVKIFSLFVTLSILHVETCMIPLWKAVYKGVMYDTSLLHFFFLHLRALTNCGDVVTQKSEQDGFFACNFAISSYRIMCNASIILKALINCFISSLC